MCDKWYDPFSLFLASTYQEIKFNKFIFQKRNK